MPSSLSSHDPIGLTPMPTRTLAPNPSYTDFQKLMDVLAVGETPAVDYLASEVDSVVVRASMESAGPARQTIQAAADEPEELSASGGLGCAQLAMWVNQLASKRRGWNKTLFWWRLFGASQPLRPAPQWSLG